MIVKVQTPLVGDQVLIYDEAYTVWQEFPIGQIPAGIVNKTRANGNRAFFRAVKNGKGQLVFGIQVSDRSW